MELLADEAEAVATHLRSLGWLADDEPGITLSSAGEGNMNRTLRADTGRRTFVLKQSVPYVAKYPDIPAPLDRIAVERRFYEMIQPVSSLALRTPQVLGFDAENHLLCLTDLGTGGDMLSAYAQKPQGQLSQGEITALVYWLWKLHSLETEPLANNDMRALNHAHIFDIPLQSDNGVGLDDDLQPHAHAMQQDNAVRDAAAALGEIYLGKAPHASRPALLHGDFYPGSWLRHPTIGVALIDPEFAFVGPPEFDLGVMVAHLTFCNFDQSDLMNVFRSYVMPPDFDFNLALRFAGMEIIRRLLGVAQLPLSATASQKQTWIHSAKAMLVA